MLVSRFLFFLIGISILGLPLSAKENCNEKSRIQVVTAAEQRCEGKIKEGIWSEQVFNALPDQSNMDFIFAFKCATGKFKDKRFLGLVKVSPNDLCKVGKPDISHVNVLDEKPL